MRARILFVVVAVASLSSVADAHFVLVSPAASLVQNRLGDPQKIGPCGGVSANPTRGTPANPGTPTNAVTQLTGGSVLHLLIQETVFHPGPLPRRPRSDRRTAPGRIRWSRRAIPIAALGPCRQRSRTLRKRR